jgi:hypothetical protein
MSPTTWHGTPTELLRLIACIDRNCTCDIATIDTAGRLCAPHHALWHEQEFRNRLVFFRRMRERLLCGEWIIDEDELSW